MQTQSGKLYLIPTGLGDNPPLEVLPISIKKVIESIMTTLWKMKTARRFIKSIHSKKSTVKIKFSCIE